MSRLPPALARREQQMKTLQENLSRLRQAEEAGEPPPVPAVQQATAAPEPAVPEALPEVIEPATPAEPLQAEPRHPDPELTDPPDLPPTPSAESLELERLRRDATAASQDRAREREEYEAENRKVREELETLRTQQETAELSVVTNEQLKAHFTPEELEMHGEESCRLILSTARKLAGSTSKQAVQRELQQVKQELSTQLTQVKQVREQLFYQALAQQIPTWQEVNRTPEWLAWLGEIDPMARVTRQELLNRAHGNLDAAAAVDIFKAFIATRPRPAPAAPANRLLPNGRPPAVPPATTTGATTRVTRAWIRDETAKFTRGVYNKDPQAWERIQATIDSAAKAGTIQ